MIDVLFILLLILLNGFLAMSEISIVSSRKARLQKLADDGTPGARSALDLSNDPSYFLSTIQVGITTVGVLTGAIGESSLAAPLSAWFSDIPWLAPYARVVSLGLVVVGITYFSVVVGELVPKRLGLLAPEVIASFVAGPMNMLARFGRPLVWLLSSSSSFVLRLIGARRSGDPPVTDDEINVLMGQGAEAGVFHESEQAIVSNVLRLDEQRIGSIMTHRNEIYMVDLDDPEEEVLKQVAQSPYTRIVVCRGGLEQIVGILRITDLLELMLAGKKPDIKAFLKQPLYVPEGVTITHLMETFRKERQQSVLIVDEYGDLQGLVTLSDVLSAIVGDIPSSNEVEQDQEIVQRVDGSWLVDGSVAIDHLKFELDIHEDLPGEDENAFNTLGGLVMYVLGRIPIVTDRFEVSGYSFEIVDMDKNRVDKVLLTKIEEKSH